MKMDPEREKEPIEECRRWESVDWPDKPDEEEDFEDLTFGFDDVNDYIEEEWFDTD
jgi:hypothetical protein